MTRLGCCSLAAVVVLFFASHSRVDARFRPRILLQTGL